MGDAAASPHLYITTSTAPRLVREIRPQPALGAPDRFSLALGVARDLIFPDPSHREISRLGIGKVQTADARGRCHRGLFGQVDAQLAYAGHIEHCVPLPQIRTRRVT